MLASILNYAVIGLNHARCINDWDPGIGRIDGFAEAVIGQPYSIFHAAEALISEHLRDRSWEADQSG